MISGSLLKGFTTLPMPEIGYLLYLTQDRAVNIHRLVNIILWLVISVLGLMLVYGYQQIKWHIWENTWYKSSVPCNN